MIAKWNSLTRELSKLTHRREQGFIINRSLEQDVVKLVSCMLRKHFAPGNSTLYFVPSPPPQRFTSIHPSIHPSIQSLFLPNFPPLLNPHHVIPVTNTILLAAQIQTVALYPSKNTPPPYTTPAPTPSRCALTLAATAAVTANPVKFPSCANTLNTPPAKPLLLGYALAMSRFDTVNKVSGLMADSSMAKKASVQYGESGLMGAMKMDEVRLMAEVTETRSRTCTLDSGMPVMMSVTAATTTMGRKRRDVWSALRDWTRWKLGGFRSLD